MKLKSVKIVKANALKSTDAHSFCIKQKLWKPIQGNHLRFAVISYFTHSPLFPNPFELQLSFRMPDPQVDIDTIKEITDMFIEAGIHMDAVNVEGLTAAQICTSRK